MSVLTLLRCASPGGLPRGCAARPGDVGHTFHPERVPALSRAAARRSRRRAPGSRPSWSTSASQTVRCSPRVRTRAATVELPGLAGPQIGDGELAGRRDVAVVRRAADRRSHGGVDQRRQDAAVHRAGRVEVLVGRLELQPRGALSHLGHDRAQPRGESTWLRSRRSPGPPTRTSGIHAPAWDGADGMRGADDGVRYRFESSGEVWNAQARNRVGEAPATRTTPSQFTGAPMTHPGPEYPAPAESGASSTAQPPAGRRRAAPRSGRRSPAPWPSSASARPTR